MFLCERDISKECKGDYRDCTDCVLDKVRKEIKDWQVDIHDNEYDADNHDFVFERIFEIIDEYRTETEESEE